MNLTARHCTWVCALLFFLPLFRGSARGQDAPQAPGAEAQLRIVIVEGEGAINNIKQRVNREPIVQVEDQNHKPIAGASVIFFLPNQGPGGVFASGAKSLTVTTNAQGRAVASGMRLNNLSGQMQIRVTASFQGNTATAVITQTNAAVAAGAAAAGAAGLSATTKLLIILAVAGGAAAAGTAVALHGGSKTGGGTSATPITITAGQPTVGAP